MIGSRESVRRCAASRALESLGTKGGFSVAPIGSVTLALGLLVSSPALATGNIEVLTSGGKVTNQIWSNASLPVVWRFNDPSTAAGCGYSSASAPIASLQPAVAAGFATWQANPSSRIAFTYGGTTATRNVGADGVNLVTFCGNGTFGTGVLARTTLTATTSSQTVVAGGSCPAGQGVLSGICVPTGTYPAGTIVDADVEFNTVGTAEASLSTNDTTPGTFDVQAIATHEEGHVAGLSHDPIFEAVMYPVIDDVPFSDDVGQRVLKTTDLASSARYYPEASFGTAFGAITGTITLDGVRAHGVHVVAIDPTTMLGYEGRFSLSYLEEPTATPNLPRTEGPDFAANGTGFYRIDGLPAGNYYVYVEAFDNSDSFTGRLQNRYNSTVALSNVATGNGGPGSLGFLPALAEFYNVGDSPNGGDGANPGTAADNSDAASPVNVSAGSVTSGIDLAFNIEPVNGQTPSQRQSPTTRSTVFNDAYQGADRVSGLPMDAGNDNFWAVRVPASALPPPPYNVAEGLWIRGGRNTSPFVASLAYGDPINASIPALGDPVLSSAGRVLSGGPDGRTAAGDFVDVRDQWNVTINDARDLYIILNQPPQPASLSLITQGFFALVTCTTAGCPSGSARVNRTMYTQDGGANWISTTRFDLFYDLILEQDPPVMINSATPASLLEGQTADVVVGGAGFQSGATVDFGPGITVNSTLVLGPTQIRCNVSVANTGATATRGANLKVTNPAVVFPNVARIFAVNPDTDGDGIGNDADCAPFDASVKQSATEVQGVRVTKAGTSAQVAWTSQDPTNGAGTSYDVVAGLAGDLRPNRGYALAVCAADDRGDTPFVDGASVGPGTGRYWLVRARNGCNSGPGTYGGSTLMPDPRDALDAGVPCP